MPEPLEQLKADYRAAFDDYLQKQDEVGLQAAYDLGRRAITESLSAMEMANIYHEKLASVLIGLSDPEAIRAAASTGASFFCESLAALEMAQRGYAEARQLYEREKDISDTLQRSLLPQKLPDIPGVEIATLYRPGGLGLRVGGDFYDVFDTGHGSWGLLVGDVVGKGTVAAAVTGMVRHTVRAAAIWDPDPTRVLGLVNQAMLRYGGGDFCTVLYGLFKNEASGPNISFACGGHPRPLVLTAEGQVAPIECEGALLGVLDDPAAVLAEWKPDPLDTLVLFTDGVIEQRTADGGFFGDDRLKSVLEGCAGFDAAKIKEVLADALDETEETPARDDIAIMIMRMTF